MSKIVCNPEHLVEHRGGIESRDAFLHRNLHWWKQNRSQERISRKAYYDAFLRHFQIPDALASCPTVAEVGPGPFGGILEVCRLEVQHKIFIDYIMLELQALDFIPWPDAATYIQSGAESIPLKDNAADALLSYNCLDHGWSWRKAVSECLRISKRGWIAFDCRGDMNPRFAKHRVLADKDHPQPIRIGEVREHVQEQMKQMGGQVQVEDLHLKEEWPVAGIVYNKLA